MVALGRSGTGPVRDRTGVRSGLYDTAEAAAREARAVINWMRGDLAATASVAVSWGETIDWRALEPRERSVLDHLLPADFPSRNGLAAQALTALVRRTDEEGSLRSRVEGAAAAVAGRVPVEGFYWEDEDPFRPGINLLLHVVGGLLHELEVPKDDGLPIRIGPFEVALDRIAV